MSDKLKSQRLRKILLKNISTLDGGGAVFVSTHEGNILIKKQVEVTDKFIILKDYLSFRNRVLPRTYIDSFNPAKDSFKFKDEAMTISEMYTIMEASIEDLPIILLSSNGFYTLEKSVFRDCGSLKFVSKDSIEQKRDDKISVDEAKWIYEESRPHYKNGGPGY